jgi:hypothetical protein
MEKFKFALLMMCFFVCFACKKQEDPAAKEIIIQDVFITDVNAERINITYKLSDLGYKETGITFYKKDNPAEQRTVLSIRKNDQFMVSMQNLEPGTEYGFKVYYTMENLDKKQDKEYIVKTLSAASLRFKMEIKRSELMVQNGEYNLVVEGEHLNELNLSELVVKVNAEPARIDYPVLVSGNSYQMTISGTTQAEQTAYSVMVYYKEQEILAQYLPAKTTGPRYFISHNLTDLPSGNLSVINNELFTFREQEVLHWDNGGQRFVPIATYDDGMVYENMQTFSFDNQIFFPAGGKDYFPNPKDVNNYVGYPAVVSFVPGTAKFETYHFKDKQYERDYLFYENSQYFIHKNQLYLAFSLVDYSGQYANKPTIRKNFVYKYNQQKKQFEFVDDLNTDILSYRFTSIDNQLYVVGLLPVVDQGYKLTATLGVLKVSDTFGLQEIFRSGTVSKPQNLKIGCVSNVDGKILIVSALNDYKIFDPTERKLYDVTLKNNIPEEFLYGLFTYHNTLHLNSGYEKYELSVSKEP